MYFMPFYINSTKRTGRTQVLTSTTSDTTLNVHNRNFRRIITFRVGSYHLYSSCRTMTSTISTINTIGQNYTIFFYPYSMPDLDRRLFRNRDGTVSLLPDKLQSILYIQVDNTLVHKTSPVASMSSDCLKAVKLD